MIDKEGYRANIGADICESINAPMVNTIANEMAKLTKEDSIKNTLTKDKTIMPFTNLLYILGAFGDD
jgi:hypothetical protein